MNHSVATVALALAMVACAETVSPPRSGGLPERSKPITLDLQSGEEAPTGVISYGDEEQAGKLGTRCWAMLCADFTGPPTPRVYLPVPGDGEMEITGDGEPESISIGRPPKEKFGAPIDERRLTVEDDRVRLDLEPGRYVLMVFARWAEGDAVLTFGLDVA